MDWSSCTQNSLQCTQVQELGLQQVSLLKSYVLRFLRFVRELRFFFSLIIHLRCQTEFYLNFQRKYKNDGRVRTLTDAYIKISTGKCTDHYSVLAVISCVSINMSQTHSCEKVVRCI